MEDNKLKMQIIGTAKEKLEKIRQEYDSLIEKSYDAGLSKEDLMLEVSTRTVERMKLRNEFDRLKKIISDLEQDQTEVSPSVMDYIKNNPNDMRGKDLNHN